MRPTKSIFRFTACLFLSALSVQAQSPVPWERQYKIKASDTARLTPADVAGPDGIVYPNWTRCGVQPLGPLGGGGIPNIKVAARIEEFGGTANDDADDSQALAKACEAAGDKGGGAVLLGEGTYYLDRPITVRRDGVVIRGKGPDKTRLIFRYAIPENGVVFYNPPAGSKVGPNTRIEMHAKPTDLMKMTIMIGEETIGAWARSTHSGNTFSFAVTGRDALAKAAPGEHTLKGVAEYKDGKKRTGQTPVTIDSKFNDTRAVADTRAVITFAGTGPAGPKIKLAEDGRRGDMKLQLTTTTGLRKGDCIFIDGPATDRWKKLTQNACLWGSYRNYALVVEAVEGSTISLNQPLRIEFPIIDGSYVQKTLPIRRCGVESLYIKQAENLWISTVIFYHGWNCWAKNVTIKKCGRFPVYGSMAKWCEIRDCKFDDAWFKGGGGTAYTGWDRCWDCLIENIETFKMRHAPCFQWAASGNVIRKSAFHESDGQWHAGWTNENLIEQCVITSVQGNGGYGYGMWASPPADTAHGPNGPRNVVYNCDVTSVKAGLWMGGMNENWIILHNRFTVDSGPGVFAKTVSFDHIIKNNVFLLKDEKSPMVHLATPDCIGVEIENNTLKGGNAKILQGPAEPAITKNNKPEKLEPAPRPTPNIPSIYEWQLKNVKTK
ncbi:MAG: right-handed parallel beta-helix repeat-containing protein [Sedimentisphaerales bacterium]|nr:right-handed parallel beta-helix repeat-containing protein [Sedimentisphaerales bacterium]